MDYQHTPYDWITTNNTFRHSFHYLIAWMLPPKLFSQCLCTALLTQYIAGDKIEKNEMGGACGTYGGRESCAQGFGGES